MKHFGHFGLLFLLSAGFMMSVGCGGDDNNNGNQGTEGNQTKAAVCGDNTRDKGEQCDDGNTSDGDGCSAKCEIEVKDCKVNEAMLKWFPEISSSSDDDWGFGSGDWGFGSGDWSFGDDSSGSGECQYYLWEGSCADSACDDMIKDEDGLKKVFQDLASSCGNGKKDNKYEECDDGNVIDKDGCSNLCTAQTVCGNGNVEDGEECDDGNKADGDGCSSSCKNESSSAKCGNGNVEDGEECDDGNKADGDGCSSSCKNESSSAKCGNGLVEDGEECDEHNNWDTATCTRNCKKVKIIECPEPCTENNTYCDSLSSSQFDVSPQCVKGGVNGMEGKYSMGSFDTDETGNCIESGYVIYTTFGNSGRLSSFKISMKGTMMCTGRDDTILGCLGGKTNLVTCHDKSQACVYDTYTSNGESYVMGTCK